MSKSGIPGISQIAQGVNAVGGVIGNILNPKAPDATAANFTATPTDPATADKTQTTEEDENQSVRGAAANLLTGGAGLSSSAPVAKNVLLGS